MSFELVVKMSDKLESKKSYAPDTKSTSVLHSVGKPPQLETSKKLPQK